MLRQVFFVALVAGASAFGLAPSAAPALRSVGKASLPLSSRPSARVHSLGGATKLSALGNLFGLGLSIIMFVGVFFCVVSLVRCRCTGCSDDSFSSRSFFPLIFLCASFIRSDALEQD